MTEKTFSITVDAAKFAYIHRFRATEEDPRFYLNGVFIDFKGRDDVLMVAADGFRMGIYRDANGAVVADPDRHLIIRINESAFLTKCLKGGKLVIEGEYGSDKAMATLVMDRGGTALTLATSVDGTYPDYIRLIPTQGIKPIPYGRFNAQYLGSFAKSKGDCHIQLFAQDQHSPHFVFLREDNDFLGIIMPVRGMYSEFPGVPAWLRPKAPVPASVVNDTVAA